MLEVGWEEVSDSIDQWSYMDIKIINNHSKETILLKYKNSNCRGNEYYD